MPTILDNCLFPWADWPLDLILLMVLLIRILTLLHTSYSSKILQDYSGIKNQLFPNTASYAWSNMMNWRILIYSFILRIWLIQLTLAIVKLFLILIKFIAVKVAMFLILVGRSATWLRIVFTITKIIICILLLLYLNNQIIKFSFMKLINHQRNSLLNPSPSLLATKEKFKILNFWDNTLLSFWNT